MNLSRSRLLSLVVVGAEYLRALWIPSGFWIVTFVSAPILALIWFPGVIDDLTFGSWSGGSQIDTRTPAPAIAACGWIFLLVFAAVLFFAHFPNK
jgi:hypothetical protein